MSFPDKLTLAGFLPKAILLPHPAGSNRVERLRPPWGRSTPAQPVLYIGIEPKWSRVLKEFWAFYPTLANSGDRATLGRAPLRGSCQCANTTVLAENIPLSGRSLVRLAFLLTSSDDQV